MHTPQIRSRLPLRRQAPILALLAALGCGNDTSQPGSDSGGAAIDIDVAIVPCTQDADCPQATGPCLVATCAPSGQCVQQPVADGTACDDTDPCSALSTCSAGICAGASACCASDSDCADKEDGDVCNGTLFCDLNLEAPSCQPKANSQVTCDDSLDTACSVNRCDPKTGACAATPEPKGKACDDGSACTPVDTCEAGICGGASTCACQSDGDCAASDDSDPCNGKLFCDLSNNTCVINPATVVQCQTTGNGPCLAWQCQPNTGSCAFGPLPKGSACDLDGSICSLDTCEGELCKPGLIDSKCACTSTADCAPFEDGNACNGTLFCHEATATCQLNPATTITCPSALDSACVANTCQPKTGACALTPAADGSPCVDGWECSAGETCLNGECATPPGQCTCQATADCAPYETSNACAKLYCHKPSGTCKVNPATIKQCNVLGDPLCSETVCQLSTGACKVQPKNEGKPCEADGSFCTHLDLCQGGSCKPADSTCPCKQDLDCAPFEDGNLCNGTLYCDKPAGKCLVNPATQKQCQGGGEGPCKPMQCQPATGECKALSQPDNTPCDSDGFACSFEACKAGACKLIAEACLCWENSDCAAFEDGNACNGTLYCNKLAGPPNCAVNPATVIVCQGAGSPDGCTGFGCDKASGACGPFAQNEGATCTDGDACTQKDACKGGGCVGAAIDVTASCDDNNPCTAAACVPTVGCIHKPSPGAPCDDGDGCTANDVCDAAAKCQAGPAKDCASDSPCLIGACTAGACVNVPAAATTTCDDGDACTDKDACDGAGACKAGAPTICDDLKPCTDDSCDKAKGCVQAPNAALCDDGDACTDKDACDGAGACKGGPLKTCDDGKACTDDSCDKAKGCVQTSNAAPCDDGDACTDKDACAGGVCQPGAPKACDDGKTCTDDSCDKAKGCVHAPNAALCDDGDACTDKDACDGAGVCKGGAPKTCDDGKPCTDDSCDKAKGCVQAHNAAPCDDGDPCTDKDACSGGACKGGAAKVCDDSDDCTTDSCNKSTGQCAFAKKLGCGPEKLPFTADFSCGSPALVLWTLANDQASPGWAFDATPNAPASVYGTCSLNFNNGKDFACDGVSKVSGSATSPPLQLGPIVKPVLELELAGQWEGVPYDQLLLEVTSDEGKSWTLVQNIAAPGMQWKTLMFDLASWKGQVVRCRLRFFTSDCFANATSGPMIDHVRVFEAGCSQQSQCEDGNACTIDTCTNGTCASASAVGTPCDDGSACTTADSCDASKTCKGTAKVCDDKDDCTADSCDVKTGACVAPKIPGCVPTTVVFAETFACGGASGQQWTLVNPNGYPYWAIDDKPSPPVAQFGGCAMNFNDDKNFKCPMLTSKVSGTATSPVIDLKGYKDLKVEALYSGSWEADNQFDTFRIVVMDEAAQVELAAQIFSRSADLSWLTATVDIAALAGQKVRLRLSFATQDCVQNYGTGPFVDRIRILGKKLSCSADQDCDDGNVCTVDACANAACTQTPKAGSACNDDNACTANDACTAQGACSGVAKSCDDGKPCTADSCDPKTGQCGHKTGPNGPCNDGDPCTGDDACDQDGVCIGKSTACNDSNPCTSDSCNEQGGGCEHVTAPGALCPGGVCSSEADCVASAARPLGAGNRRVGYQIVNGKLFAFGNDVAGLFPADVAPGGGPYPLTNLKLLAVAMVVADEDRACAIHTSGALTCWGSNTLGAVMTPTAVPIPEGGVVWGAGRAQQLIFVDATGALWELKQDNAKFALVKGADAPPEKPYLQVAAGFDFTCARRKNKVVYCWGKNGSGQLGPTGGVEGNAIAVPAEVPVTGTIDLCAGSQFACALDAQGTVRCWGDGSEGQLGNGQSKSGPTPVTVTDTANASGASKAISLRCGQSHACVGTAGGGVRCWGRNDRGQLGCGDTKRHTETKSLLAHGTTAYVGEATQAFALPDGGCVHDAGKTRCWGDNGSGILARWSEGSPSDPARPAEVVLADGSILADVSDIIGQDGALCARTGKSPDFDWYCFGENRGGVTGLASPSDQALQVATPAPLLQGIATAALTDEEGCRIVPTSGQVECWGTNMRSNIGAGATLGTATTGPIKTPTPVALPQGAVATALSRSYHHACALTNLGLYCWGLGGNGLLGIGSEPTRAPPTKVDLLDGAVQVRTSYTHSCARTPAGAIFCWGSNVHGALGKGDVGGKALLPTKSLMPVSASDLSIDAFGSLAVGTNGTAYGFGKNGGATNALGLSNAFSDLVGTPKPVFGWGLGGQIIQQPPAQAVAASLSAGCVRSGGTVGCFGDNSAGKLGQGHTQPIQLIGQPAIPKHLSNVVQIHAALHAICARTTLGHLWCWGNRDGPFVGRGSQFAVRLVSLPGGGGDE